MDSLKKLGLFVKVVFLSIFGTSRGLQNIEEDLASISKPKPLKKKQADKPRD